MKNSDMKVIAIIVTIALVLTVLTSNVVSIASVIFLAKDAVVEQAPEGEGSGTEQQAGTNNGSSSNAGTSSGSNAGTSTDANAGTSTDTNAGTSTDSNAGTSTDTNAGTSTDTNAGTSTDNNAGADNAGTPDADANNAGDANQGATKSNAEVLKIYTTVMNKAKADKPGYKKVEYQELPSDAESRVISKGSGLVGTLLNLVDTLGIMTSKETAEADPEIVEKGGDMRWFPVYKCEKGCYLTDVSAIKSTKYEDLGNGIARITIVLNDEANPEPMAEGASTSPSKTGAMFSPLSKVDIDNTVNGGTVSAVIKNVTYSLNYHDCTAIVEYNTKTNEIIKLEQYMNVAIQGGGKIFGVSEIKIDKQELLNTMIITDFQY